MQENFICWIEKHVLQGMACCLYFFSSYGGKNLFGLQILAVLSTAVVISAKKLTQLFM
jgi:hypothetical protein